MRVRRLGLLGGLVFVPIAALLAAGCGGGGKKASSETTNGAGSGASTTISTPAVDSAVAAQVPAKFKGKTLTVATYATYAPNEFIGADGHTIVGMDVDLAKALAAVMGVKVKLVNTPFASIISGVASGKYDLAMSSITDTKAREKTVDFVTYFSAGSLFYANQQGGPVITSLADLCGHSVAVQRGTTQLADATAQNEKCKAAGNGGVTVHVYPSLNAASVAVHKGVAQIGMADSPVAAYIATQSNGQFKLTGKPYNTAPYGIAISKGSGMAKPVLAAVKALMAGGTYKAIVTRWSNTAGEITNPQINGATT
jgi:polar amino acid transport system substrate-binding protein